MNMMIRGSANSITSGFPFPLKEALPPWAFRKSRIPACLRSLFAAPKYPHFREEKRHGVAPGLAAHPRRHTYFKGYFQTEQYFLHCREQLCREFHSNLEHALDTCSSSEPQQIRL